MFIGTKEVSSVEGTKVTFVDGTEKDYPEVTITIKPLDALMTKEEKDLTAMRDLTSMHVVDKMLDVAGAFDIPKGYVNHTVNLFVHSYEMQLGVAIGKAFGIYDEKKHPSCFEEELRMSDFKKFK